MTDTPQTSLQAFLFTDIVGSTDLKRKLGDVEGAQLIVAHDASFRECVARFRGTEQNNPGDGFFATFPVPSAALNCALAFQDALAGQSVEARVGIHMGEAVHVPAAGDADKLLGLAVDTAGRVMSLAMPNQILITRHAFDSARQQVLRGPNEESVVWRAHGTYHFKGLDQPIEIHEAGIKGVAPLSPPPDSQKAQRAIAHGDEETLGWRPGVGLSIPDRGGWRLERELGTGGFGEVWLAVSERTKEQRAFKFCFRADRLRTLKRELTLFRLLKETLGEREDIARLYDVRLDEAPFFLEMEYTPDGSLDRWAAVDGRLDAMPLKERAQFVAEVGEALAAAHSVGVLHKDVKPPNVLVRLDTGGRPHARLTDFGIGQLMDPAILEAAQVSATGFTETGVLTDLGSRTGTRLYMAPELFAGKPASIASDVFALGVLLYQMIVGDLSRPLAQGWERDIPDPLLVEDIAACIAGNPKERPASCDVVAAGLRSLEARRQERAEDARRVAAEARRARLFRLTSVAAVVLAIAAIAGIVVASVLDRRRREAEEARAETQRALNDVARERDAKARALAQVLRLSDSKRVSDLIDETDDLWPLHPDRAQAMAGWLSRAEAVLGNRPGHAEAVADLRELAEPYTEGQRKRDHAGPIARLETLRAALAGKREPPKDEAKRTVWAKKRAAAEKQAETLAAAVVKRASWSFPGAEDDWRHQVLSDLLAGLDRLGEARKRIAERHTAALTLRARSIDAHKDDWDQTTKAIAASPKYNGQKLVPQLGLIPLGPDPESGLFEFAHLGSGSVPQRDPKTKRLVLTDDFAIVFILIPGGTFRMGAQKADATGPNHDPRAERFESPVHEVKLSPYFFAKYECTQAQWAKLSDGQRPSLYGPRSAFAGKKVTLRHPVEQVPWNDCARWFVRNGIALPSEAQWEFACRAGTQTPWFTGRDENTLSRVANIADAFLKANGGAAGWSYSESVNDGHVVHAPVGSLAANAFGVHDVHGNVWEWCRDALIPFTAKTATDPLVLVKGDRVLRGGSWNRVASYARSATREALTPSFRSSNLGVRPARAVTSE